MYSIGKFAKEIGVTTQTLRNWHKTKELIPFKITEGGTRYYNITWQVFTITFKTYGDFWHTTEPQSYAGNFTADGFYRVVSLDIAGNSRGNDWYIDGVCVPLGDTPDGKKVTGNG